MPPPTTGGVNRDFPGQPALRRHAVPVADGEGESSRCWRPASWKPGHPQRRGPVRTFHPGDKEQARVALGIPVELWSCCSRRQPCARTSGRIIPRSGRASPLHRPRADCLDSDISSSRLGKRVRPEQIGAALVRFVPYQTDPAGGRQLLSGSGCLCARRPSGHLPQHRARGAGLWNPGSGHRRRRHPRADRGRSERLSRALGDAPALAERLARLLSDDDAEDRHGDPRPPMARGGDST